MWKFTVTPVRAVRIVSTTRQVVTPQSVRLLATMQQAGQTMQGHTSSSSSSSSSSWSKGLKALLGVAGCAAVAAGMVVQESYCLFGQGGRAEKATPKTPEERYQKHLQGMPMTKHTEALLKLIEELPQEEAKLTVAPNVPPPITRQHPVRLIVNMNSTMEVKPISNEHKYPFWTYNGSVPGPFIRARVGDVMEVRYTNKDSSGVAHNIDFHAVTGPGGGAPCLLAEKDETKIGIFQLLQPGLYIYHCAAAPVPQHVQNGMYGLILVEPKEGLPKADKEFYVLQSEWYGEENSDDKKLLDPSFADGLMEHPYYVTFNGRVGALTEAPLLVNADDRVRLFVGNAGPNLVSSFHVIGAIFDKVYREGDLVSPPARGIQTTLIPAGGASVVEWDAVVPGNFTLVDHSIFRIEKGAIGFVKVQGEPRPDIFDSVDRPTPCPGCKLHN